MAIRIRSLSFGTLRRGIAALTFASASVTALSSVACSAQSDEPGPSMSALKPGDIVIGDDGNQYQVLDDGTLGLIDPATGMLAVDDTGQVISVPADAVGVTPSTPAEGTGGGGTGPSTAPTDDILVPLDEPEFLPGSSLPPGCGNGVIDDAEVCDDGNSVAGTSPESWDGCGNCMTIDPGFVCGDPGTDCVYTSYCGDGRVTPPETCDDLNDVDGDGCASSCATEDGWACPQPGEPCVYTVVCGDGVLAGNEICDDLNTESGDGCSADCLMIESGWTCSTAGLRCAETCGDGVPTGRETCDDGNVAPGDGCSAACQIEPVFEDMDTNTMVGWTCPPDGGACTSSVCGDGMLQGEPCDDGNNNDMGDGCSPGCRLEPDCTAEDGTCVSSCGDGLILSGDNEECDDGNNRSGDGCSETCTVEGGFMCTTVDDGTGTSVTLPIVYRDFYGIGWEAAPAGTPPEYNPEGHPDFENEAFSRNTPKVTVTSSAAITFGDIAAPTQGLVNAELGAMQNDVMSLKPVFASTGTPAQITSAATFHQWYADTPGTNVTLVDSLVLDAAGAAGTFVFDTDQFYPIDTRGLTAETATAPGPEPMRPVDWLGQGCGQRQATGEWTDLTLGMPRESRDTHNYSFTSEVRYWFEYQGGEQLTFRGDDDVWVYIKRRLVVDLGGNHEPYGGDVCGQIWAGIEAQPECAGLSADSTDVSGAPLDLEVGRVYEAVVFQAERHSCQSNYRLTLANFARRHSECATVCGDGIVAGDEQCDDGQMNGEGYGFCTADCTPGPRCGDQVLDAAFEQCDNGANLDVYYVKEGDCAPGCTLPGFCGDAVVDTGFDERCDLGADLNVGDYNGCDANCQLGPRCGDGVLQADQGEECDDGNRRNGDTCSGVCTVERRPGAR